MPEEYYTEEDFVPRSPPLKAIPFKPQAVEPLSLSSKPRESHHQSRSSSPEASDSETVPGDGKRRSKKKKKVVTKPTQGDFVLISHLAPDRLDIASIARERLLEGPASDDERNSIGEGDFKGIPRPAVSIHLEKSKPTTSTSDVEMEVSTMVSVPIPPALEPQNPMLMNRGMPREPVVRQSRPQRAVRRQSNPILQPSPTITSGKVGRSRNRKEEDLIKLSTVADQAEQPQESRRDAADSLMQLRRSSDGREIVASSPKLKPLMYNPAEMPSEQRLHGMHGIHGSPPEVAELNGSPRPNLPTIKPLLGIADSEIQQTTQQRGRALSTASYTSAGGLSPTMGKQFPGGRSPGTYSHSTQSVSGNTPSSVRSSEPTPSDRPSHAVTSPVESHLSYPPNLTYATSNMTSNSSGSPSNRTSSTHPTPGELQMSIEGETLDGTRPTSSGSTQYRCPYSDCNAAPFATQYLLNSHMNVHSDVRLHFCPVKECNRGPGGTGFKRKNEMIRHRLVHDSPGYICPFCPDRDHRYPRPDNLQRHVRMHHEGKSKDDPALRDVLSRRPQGAGQQSRRRRNLS